MRCDLRTVKHSLQTVYPCCRSVRSVRIDTWLIRTVTVRVYWTTLARANHLLLFSASPNATVGTEAKSSPQRRQTFFVKARGSRRNFSNLIFNSLLHCYCIAFKCYQKRIVATWISYLQFERAGNKTLCAVDYIFNLLCSLNSL